MIPVATNSITISRVVESPDTDGYDSAAPGPTVIVSNVRAAISPATANQVLSGGDRVVYSARITADPCDLEVADTVTDDTGTEWECLWSRPFGAFGISYIEGELQLVTGAA